MGYSPPTHLTNGGRGRGAGIELCRWVQISVDEHRARTPCLLHIVLTAAAPAGVEQWADCKGAPGMGKPCTFNVAFCTEDQSLLV